MTDVKSMRRVSAYKTNDGEVFEDRNLAVAHQARIDLIRFLLAGDNLDVTPTLALEIADRLIDQPSFVRDAAKARRKIIDAAAPEVAA